MSNNKIRDNFGRFQKEATIHISKMLQQEADKLCLDVSLIVADKLKRTYTEQVLSTYEPRSEAGKQVVAYNKKQHEKEKKSGRRKYKKKLTYHHTNTFEKAIDVAIEKDANATKPKNQVKVVIKEKHYPDEQRNDITTKDVYNFLTEGTTGSDKKYVKENDNGDKVSMQNYPTPIHPFEAHTMEEMKGFLATLDLTSPKYTRSKRYKLKKRRK